MINKIKNNPLFLKFLYSVDNFKFIFLLSFFVFLYIPLFNFFININKSGGKPFITDDWLINYNHGFVRRGLFGTLLLNSRFYENKLDLLSYTLIIFYIILIILSIYIFTKFYQNTNSYILLFSPIFLFFPRLDFGGGFRKEILGLISFCIFVVYFEIFKNKIILFLGSFFILFAVFTSEVNLFIYPFLTWLILRNKKINLSEVALIYIPLILYIFSFFFLFGDSQLISSNLCKDAINLTNNDSICGGIDWLAYDLITTINIVNEKLMLGYSSYIISALFSFLPFYKTDFLNKNKLMLIFTIICFAPLFIVALDWGRWLYIYFYCLYLIYFSENKKNRGLNLYIALIFIPLNTTSWRALHFGNIYEDYITYFLDKNILISFFEILF